MDNNHKIGQIINLVLAVILIIGVALTVYAVNQVRSINSEAKGRSAKAHASITVPDSVFEGVTVATVATVNQGSGSTYVKAQCHQDNNLVFAQYAPVDSNFQAVIGLGPTPRWSSGAAECTAEEGFFKKGGRWSIIAKTTFNAAAQ